ncbi:MAG: AAA family ATPase [Patescibacteria group bacterium]
MYFKSLTLSGFKSFGKSTVFEFPSRITSIVGPNGSGKSNIVEAIRWVLGEQSIKSLRGKKGEDLIFNGSDKAARLGKAEAKLIFDNSKKQFPYEFDEVIISRRVIRDGTNEYLLNGSQVRLKDIFQLLSTVGFGSTQHHIISQGEVDRILWASPRDRQEMIEEALGLKEYHLKKRDAERKLGETENNLRQIDAQVRELRPHLKYLGVQAEKMKATEEYRIDLQEKAYLWASRERAALAEITDDVAVERDPLEESLREKSARIKELTGEIARAEKSFSGLEIKDAIKEKLTELDERRRALERELGRIEGLLAAGAGSKDSEVSVKMITGELRETLLFVKEIAEKESFETLKSGLNDIKVRLEKLLKLSVGDRDSAGDLSLEKKKQEMTYELRQIEHTVTDLRAKREETGAVREDTLRELREREHEIRTEERELEAIRAKLRTLDFEGEKYKVRHAELANFMRDLKIEADVLPKTEAFEGDADRAQLMRQIERLRIRLEEAGGIDVSVVREYEDTKSRDEFLTRELRDINDAAGQLKSLMKELDQKLHEKFSEGLESINEEFLALFRSVFGGGKAKLVYVSPQVSEIGEVVEGGIEIELDIPRKRLRSLDMLSGGERALTSVALLFAMSAVNPPPFLVLDETDAALDEANSQRYGDLLEQLAQKTQLIIVTHNRHTMQRAGILYGVTMSGDGISRVISLKLEEAKEFAKEG